MELSFVAGFRLKSKPYDSQGGEEWAQWWADGCVSPWNGCGVGTDYGGRHRRHRVARADHIWNCLAGPNSGGRSADQPCTFSNYRRRRRRSKL